MFAFLDFELHFLPSRNLHNVLKSVSCLTDWILVCVIVGLGFQQQELDCEGKCIEKSFKFKVGLRTKVNYNFGRGFFFYTGTSLVSFGSQVSEQS